jgi:hypothetical protein
VKKGILQAYSYYNDNSAEIVGKTLAPLQNVKIVQGIVPDVLSSLPISDQVISRTQNEPVILPSGNIAGLNSVEHLEDTGSGTLSRERRIGKWREELTSKQLREVEAVIYDAWRLDDVDPAFGV